jgi:ArsR family metal-binding transcriptional regulator
MRCTNESNCTETNCTALNIHATATAVTKCTVVWDNKHRLEHQEKLQLERISTTVSSSIYDDSTL